MAVRHAAFALLEVLFLTPLGTGSQQPLPSDLRSRALTLLEQQRYEEAAPLLETLAAADPGDLGIAIARTKALLERGLWPEALGAAEALARRFPGHPEPALLLGDLRFFSFDVPGALEAYRRALCDPVWGERALQKGAAAALARGDEETVAAWVAEARLLGRPVPPAVEAAALRADPDPARRLSRLRGLLARLPGREDLRNEVSLWTAILEAGGGAPPLLDLPGKTAVREVYGEPCLRVTLNGARKTWMAFDTGSESLLLNEDLARRMGLAPLGRSAIEGWGYHGTLARPVVLLDSLETAGMRAEKVPALQNPRDSEFWSNKAGYIGLWPFLSACVLYDRRGGRFEVYPAGTAAAALLGQEGFTLPVLWYRGVPLVPVRLAGKGPFPFLLDTGAPLTLLSRRYAAGVGIRANTGKYGKLYGLGQSGGFTSSVAEQVFFEVGPRRYERRVIFVTDIPERFPVPLYGILGRDVLNDYKMVFDGPACRVTLVPYD
ncbi:MAG: aspartyl protease family protein [Acidobacteriota bacterium]